MSNQTILITGASTGIGKATARYFQERGWNVIATMRTPEKEAELTQLERVLVTRLDVLDGISIQQAVAKGIETFGKIDVLVNNAGYGAYGPLESFPMEKVRRQFDTNVIGLLEVTKAVLPHFRQNMSGYVVNVSSVGGKMAFPLGTLYHGTKFAVEGLSEALQYELEPLGVKVKIIEPGAIVTDFVSRSFDFHNDESIAEYQGTVSALLSAFESLSTANASPASAVAEVIYTSVTDNSNQLRYAAAGGSETFLANRAAADDETFFQGVKAMVGLS